MTNDELKKKILEIFEKAIGDWYEKDDGLFAEGYTPEEGDNRLKAFMADALIAAGLRFGENLTATFDHMALEREHELERRLAEAEHRAEVLERALQGACCYIDALGEGCGCCAFIKDDLKCRENCDFLAGLTTFWRNKAEEELKVEKGK